MPKQNKKFIVYTNDVDMYVYIPEDDDHAVSTKRATVLTFKEAKELILKNLKEKYERDVSDITSLTYKDF